MPAALASPKTLRLQYFNIEGPAEKSRLAMRIAKIPFTDDRVDFAKWPSEIKPTTPYGQLPLMHVDESHTIAQSDAILRYVGGLSKTLYPADVETRTAIDEALSLVDEINQSWYYALVAGINPAKLGHDVEKGSEEHGAVTKKMRERWMADEFPRYAGFLTKRVEGGKMLVGDAVTIADCAVIPLLRRFCSGDVDHVDPTCMSQFPEVKAYYDRFHAIPEVAAWYEERAQAQKAA
jgi:glutathione S-transferase